MTDRQQDGVESLSPLAVVAAILLPPLGVFIARGLTAAFWLTVVATLIGWVPGIVLALLLLFVPERIPVR
jgi:uncharacterized membrane protein YqaE (UPF0057 family)